MSGLATSRSAPSPDWQRTSLLDELIGEFAHRIAERYLRLSISDTEAIPREYVRDRRPERLPPTDERRPSVVS